MSLRNLIHTSGSVGIGLFAWAQSAFATATTTTLPTGLSGANDTLEDVGAAAQLTASAEQSLPVLVGQVINVILGLLGIIFVAFVVYAGIIWMTAQGDPEKTKKSIAIIRNAIIGMVITVGAYAISNFVISALVTATA